MGMISHPISNEHKLINFNVPKYLIKNFDNLVRFKRVSRTSMLIHLMEHYIRTEKKSIMDDHNLNSLINDIEERNRKSVKDEMIGLHREIEEEYEPPLPPTQQSIEEDHSKDDWDDISGISRFWNMK